MNRISTRNEVLCKLHQEPLSLGTFSDVKILSAYSAFSAVNL
jgi:hypothetical protein